MDNLSRERAKIEDRIYDVMTDELVALGKELYYADIDAISREKLDSLHRKVEKVFDETWDKYLGKGYNYRAYTQVFNMMIGEGKDLADETERSGLS